MESIKEIVALIGGMAIVLAPVLIRFLVGRLRSLSPAQKGKKPPVDKIPVAKPPVKEASYEPDSMSFVRRIRDVPLGGFRSQDDRNSSETTFGERRGNVSSTPEEIMELKTIDLISATGDEENLLDQDTGVSIDQPKSVSREWYVKSQRLDVMKRVEYLSPLKRAVILSEILGPPRSEQS